MFWNWNLQSYLIHHVKLQIASRATDNNIQTKLEVHILACTMVYLIVMIMMLMVVMAVAVALVVIVSVVAGVVVVVVVVGAVAMVYDYYILRQYQSIVFYGDEYWFKTKITSLLPKLLYIFCSAGERN